MFEVGFGIISLSVVVQGLVEGITSPVVLPEKYSEISKRLLAFLVALFICVGFGVDYSYDLLGSTPNAAWVGYVFTALIIGFGSSVIHKIVKRT